MACTVQLSYYDSRSGEAVDSKYTTQSHLYINGVSAEGESYQENTQLVFSFSDTLPGYEGEEGYTFKEWKMCMEGSEEWLTVGSDDTFTVDATEKSFIEVRCYLTPVVVHIIYDYMNPTATGSYTQEALFADNTTTLMLSPCYNGHLMNGWQIEGELYAPGSIYVVEKDNVRAVGVWITSEEELESGSTEIEYQDEDGNVIDSVIALKGLAIALKNLNANKTNDGGWTITGGGGSTSKKSGGTFTPGKDDKYTAKANPKERVFQVSFNTNNSKIQGDPKYRTQYIVKGQSVEFPKGVPDKSETMKFTGWSCCGGVYKPEEKMVVTSNCIASAIYCKKDQEVRAKFVRGDTTIEEITVSVGKPYGTVPTVTVKDWEEFVGWFTLPGKSGGSEIKATSTVIYRSDHTIYARIKTQFKLIVSPNGGKIDGKEDAVTLYYKDGDTISKSSLPIPTYYYGKGEETSEGFVDYYTSADATGGELVPDYITAKEGETYICYARWKAKVIFNAGEGTCSLAYKYVLKKSPIGSLPEATREDYEFGGWYTEPDGDGKRINETTEVENRSVFEVYAKYSLRVQTVTFNTNGGLPETMDTQKYTMGERYGTLPKCAYKPPSSLCDGEFEGWYTAAKGGSEVKWDTIVTSDTTRTLYAQYKTYNLIQVTFQGNEYMLYDKENGIKGMTLYGYYRQGEPYRTGGSPKEFPTPIYPEGGLEFFGFFTDRKSGVQVYNTMKAPTGIDTRTLYAHHKVNKEQNTITYNSNGGTCNRTEQGVPEGKEIGSLPNGEKEGYTLVGYTSSQPAGVLSKVKKIFTVRKENSKARENAGEYIDPSFVPTSDMTLTAQWAKKIKMYYFKGTDEH